MEGINKALLIAGVGIGALGGLAYLMYQGITQTENNKGLIPREQVLKMLKEYKRSSLRVFVKQAEIFQRISQEFGGKQEIQPGITIKNIIEKDVQKDLEDERKYVANKYEIPLEVFEDSYKFNFQEDKEIQQICQWINSSQENCLMGIPPSLNVKTEVQELFPIDKVIDLHKKILKLQSISFNKVFKELKSESNNEINTQSEQFKRKIRDLDIHQIKTDLLKEEGFEFEPESPCETFEKLSLHYKKTSQVYDQKFSQVIAIYEKIKSDMLYSQVTDSYINQMFS